MCHDLLGHSYHLSVQQQGCTYVHREGSVGGGKKLRPIDIRIKTRTQAVGETRWALRRGHSRSLGPREHCSVQWAHYICLGN